MSYDFRHLVFFKFREGVDPPTTKRIVKEFLALRSAIPLIQNVEWGTDASVEKLSRGFSHCFNLGFADPAARNAYLVHPAHTAFSASLEPFVAEVFVFDYHAGT